MASPKVEKANREKFLTVEQVKHLLGVIQEIAKPKWRRDHCIVFMGFHFGLRISECSIMERASFRFMGNEQAMIRTRKNSPRIQQVCASCSRRWRVSVNTLGNTIPCPRCGTEVEATAPRPADEYDMRPPEMSPPVVEERVWVYAEKYMRECMRDDQQWLFESKPGQRVSVPHVRRIFNFYCMQARLPAVTSFHALRHARGVHIYEKFRDHVMTRDMLRQKSLSSAEWYMHLSPAKQAEYQNILDSETELDP